MKKKQRNRITANFCVCTENLDEPLSRTLHRHWVIYWFRWSLLKFIHPDLLNLLYFLSYELVMSSVFIIAQRSLNHIRSHIKSDFMLLFMFNIVNVNCVSFSGFLEWNIKSRAGNYEGLRPQSAWTILSHRPLTVLPCNPAHVNNAHILLTCIWIVCVMQKAVLSNPRWLTSFFSEPNCGKVQLFNKLGLKCQQWRHAAFSFARFRIDFSLLI